MKILVAGASGATGRWLVAELLRRGHQVKAVVRSTEKVAGFWKGNGGLQIVEAAILDLTDEEMAKHVRDCDAVASCLGHNMTFKGMFGKPRRLVTDAVRRLNQAIRASQPERPVRFVLMNTTANSNRDLQEPIPFKHRMVIGLLRILLPPHVDNEQAADYLRTRIGQKDGTIEWVAVRPDGLIDEGQVSEYEIHPSPIRNPIFNPGKVSRINVGHFMASLITEDELWDRWKGQMPVVYNSESLRETG